MLGTRPESPNKNASTHGPFLESLGFLARRLDPESYQLLCQEVLRRIVEDAKHAAQRRTLRFIINDIAASPEMTQSGT